MVSYFNAFTLRLFARESLRMREFLATSIWIYSWSPLWTTQNYQQELADTALLVQLRLGYAWTVVISLTMHPLFKDKYRMKPIISRHTYLTFKLCAVKEHSWGCLMWKKVFKKCCLHISRVIVSKKKKDWAVKKHLEDVTALQLPLSSLCSEV